jgi:hypothetical protein
LMKLTVRLVALKTELILEIIKQRSEQSSS